MRVGTLPATITTNRLARILGVSPDYIGRSTPTSALLHTPNGTPILPTRRNARRMEWDYPQVTESLGLTTAEAQAALAAADAHTASPSRLPAHILPETLTTLQLSLMSGVSVIELLHASDDNGPALCTPNAVIIPMRMGSKNLWPTRRCLDALDLPWVVRSDPTAVTTFVHAIRERAAAARATESRLRNTPTGTRA